MGRTILRAKSIRTGDTKVPIADNTLAMNAGWDEDALAAELADLDLVGRFLG
jgi:hypothetical protein